ncbi:MAG: dihydrofolate reductase [Anaerolineaceae bacterium]|nr:dihydrofolate reductase [Anaerolineaceae bacterium]
MRKIIVTEFISLDGVIEDPKWTFKYWNDEIAGFKAEETSANEDLLLGRVTYQGFAAAWPNRKDEDPGAAYFNGTRKYVVTSMLDKAEWNNSVIIKGNVMEEITKLKQQDGPNIVVHGSATLAQTLMQNQLVDELRLLMYPVVLATGKRLFNEDHPIVLKLLSSRNFSGVLGLVYAPE